MIRNRAVLNAIRDAVFLADADTGMIVDANRAAESLCGRSLTELQSLHHTELHTPALAEAARGSFENNAQAPGLTEGIIQHKDGRRIPVEASSSSFTAPYGRRMLIGVFRDISERLAAREALRRNERIYRAIGESIDYGVWVCAPDGRNTYASESFLKLVGQTQEQCSSFGWSVIPFSPAACPSVTSGARFAAGQDSISISAG